MATILDSLPTPEEVRRRLAAALTEVDVLRIQLRASERAAKGKERLAALAQQSPKAGRGSRDASSQTS